MASYSSRSAVNDLQPQDVFARLSMGGVIIVSWDKDGNYTRYTLDGKQFPVSTFKAVMDKFGSRLAVSQTQERIKYVRLKT